MGLFLNNKKDRYLLKEFAKIYQKGLNISEKEAKKMVKNLINKAKDDSSYTDIRCKDLDYGDYLLSQENYDKKIKKRFNKIRKDGVTNEDIKRSHNGYYIKKFLIISLDNIHKLKKFEKYIKEDGLSDEEAMIKIKKYSPMFDDPEEIIYDNNDDRPLPFELSYRIAKFIKNNNIYKLKKYQEEIEKSSSFNSFIRRYIKKGDL